MNILNRAMSAAVVALCLVAPCAHASVVIAGTRVVFDAGQGETTVRLTNDNTRPALVEAWIDDGDAHSTPDSARTPFLITPPLFRMEPHKDQSLRILYVQGSKPLPADRESLFWLNVLEIPPKPTGVAADKNTLQFAIRSRLKFFYRPANLPGDSTQAPGRLIFTAATEGQNVTLVAHNPTPYYITISKLSMEVGGKMIASDTGMVAPFSDLKLSVKGLSQPPAAGTAVTFSTINDYGTGDAHKGVIAK
ncbi:MAG: fimbrial biogenesis chaperone [Rhodanobacteraceae bacterium]